MAPAVEARSCLWLSDAADFGKLEVTDASRGADRRVGVPGGVQIGAHGFLASRGAHLCAQPQPLASIEPTRKRASGESDPRAERRPPGGARIEPMKVSPTAPEVADLLLPGDGMNKLTLRGTKKGKGSRHVLGCASTLSAVVSEEVTVIPLPRWREKLGIRKAPPSPRSHVSASDSNLTPSVSHRLWRCESKRLCRFPRIFPPREPMSRAADGVSMRRNCDRVGKEHKRT